MGRLNASDNKCGKRLQKGIIVISISVFCILISLINIINETTSHSVLYNRAHAVQLNSHNNINVQTFEDDMNSKPIIGGCKSAVISIESTTRAVIEGSNYNAKLPMASTTKVLTAYIACVSGKMNEIYTIPTAATGIEGSSIYLKPNEKILLRDLVYGLMLRSGNDSAVAIALCISGSIDNFAILMNQVSKEIGAVNSNFVNPHGLHDENHYTTAYDLAIITATALSNNEFRSIVSAKTHVLKSAGEPDRYLANKNKMLNMYDGAIGVKTGYTKVAGRCLVAAAERNGLEIVTVVLNIPDMWEHSSMLLNNAFSTIRKIELASANVEIARIKVAGSNSVMPICIRESYSIITKANEVLDINSTFEFDESIHYPIKTNVKLGKFSLFNGKRLIFRTNIYSIIDIQGKGVFPIASGVQEWMNYYYGTIN